MSIRMSVALLLSLTIALSGLAACRWGAPTEQDAAEAPAVLAPVRGLSYSPLAAPAEAGPFPLGEVAAEGESASSAPVEEAAEGAPQAAPAFTPTAAPYPIRSDVAYAPAAGADRLVVKNAELQLLVAETTSAVDRITQIVADAGGYVLSSRVWYDQIDGEPYQNATITLAVPADQFEQALSRLRKVANRVLNDAAWGEDVTEQFVDLESRLANLKATRDRIRDFLDRAETVAEALRVNEELAAVEAQIEATQGRMNYLAGRAAYSTITVTVQPEIAELLTPTPTPTATPASWTPGRSFTEASATLRTVYQGLADVLIWVAVVGVPVLAPLALAMWVIWRFAKGRPGQRPV